MGIRPLLRYLQTATTTSAEIIMLEELSERRGPIFNNLSLLQRRAAIDFCSKNSITSRYTLVTHPKIISLLLLKVDKWIGLDHPRRIYPKNPNLWLSFPYLQQCRQSHNQSQSNLPRVVRPESYKKINCFTVVSTRLANTLSTLNWNTTKLII